MQKSYFVIFLVFILYAIPSVSLAQDNSWLQGNWSGKAHFSGSDASVYYKLNLRILAVDGKKFEGIYSTMDPYDTTIRYDARVWGMIDSNFIVILKSKIFYIRNAENARWKTSCENCRSPRMIFAFSDGKFGFTSEQADCYKECNGTKEFSKDLDAFDPAAKKSLIAKMKIIENNAADSSQLVASGLPEKKPDTAVISIVNNAIEKPDSSATIAMNDNNSAITKTKIITGTVITTDKNTSQDLSQKAPKTLDKNVEIPIVANDLPVVPHRYTNGEDNTVTAAEKKNLVTSSNPPDILKKTMQSLPLGYTERKVNVVQTIIVNTDSITLRVYDNGVIDGDIVSVIYNDNVVIDKLSLTAKATVIKVPVKTDGTNKLIFHAHNLGEFPPNTARLEIIYGKKEEDLTVASDLTVSSAINILYQQDK